MGLKKVSNATKRVKGSKGFGKGIAKQKQIGRIQRSKAQRDERSVKADAAAKTRTPLLERTDRDAETTTKAKKGKGGKAPGFEAGMNVDDFLEGGFEKAMAEEDDDDEEEAPKPKAKAKAKVPKEDHKTQLSKLKQQDPAFYEYLQKTDKSLLSFDSDEDDDEDDEEGQEGEDDDDDDEFEEGMEGMDDDAMVDDGDDDDDDDAEPEADDDDEAAQAPTKESKQKATVQQVEVTAELVREWQRKLSKGAENGAALKQLVSAFRCAVHYGDEDDDEGAQEFAYSFTSGHVFNMLVQFCLQRMDGLLRRHCAGSEADAKKGAPRSKGAGAIERVDQWPHWRRHQLSTRSYLTQAAHFLAKLSEPEMTLAVLQQVHRLLPFYVALPKLVPKLFRTLVKIWSGGTGGNKDTCLLAFACIRQLAAEMPAPFIDTALKACYLAFAQMSRSMNRKTLQRIALTSACFVDLCAIDASAAYQHAFVYIRQLAIHLRNAIQKPTADAYRQVYNWQYINCLRLWAQVLCAHGRSATAPLRQLLYPLVQVTSGVARLLPNIRFAALRLQCVRVLNQLAAELRVYVPVAPLLLEVFKFSELGRSPTGNTTERLLDWAVLVKVSNTDAGRRQYQEGVLVQSLFRLAEHLNAVSYSVAFPEVAVPLVLALRRAAKKTKIVAFQKRCRALLAQIEAQAQWVARKRSTVDFAPKDRKPVDDFLAEEREAGDGPYAKWFKTQLTEIEAAEAQMREVGEKQAEGKGIKADDDDDDDDDDGDDDDDDEEIESAGKAKAKKGKPSKQAASAAADGKPAKKRKSSAAASASNNTGDDVVERMELSDSDDE